MNISAMAKSSGTDVFAQTFRAMSERATVQGNQETDERTEVQRSPDVLGKDDFLKLLVTQLRYQDPMQPIDDQDFIAQMAQFTALEQMQNMAAQMELFLWEQRQSNMMAQATTLLGREVKLETEDGIRTGRVEAVRLFDGVPRLVVDGDYFDVSDVIEVVVTSA